MKLVFQKWMLTIISPDLPSDWFARLTRVPQALPPTRTHQKCRQQNDGFLHGFAYMVSKIKRKHQCAKIELADLTGIQKDPLRN